MPPPKLSKWSLVLLGVFSFQVQLNIPGRGESAGAVTVQISITCCVSHCGAGRLRDTSYQGGCVGHLTRGAFHHRIMVSYGISLYKWEISPIDAWFVGV